MTDPITPPPERWASQWISTGTVCPKCGSAGTVKYREVESHRGGFCDYQYACRDCGKEWWIDGIAP
jgi:transposase-like protein